MSNRIDVFTDELKKVWTILQQQQVMINAIKDNINAIEKNTTDIDNVNKVVPTDIDMDSNCKLVLKHDGQELTGQVKNVSGVSFISVDFSIDSIDYSDASTRVETKDLIKLIMSLNYDSDNCYPLLIYVKPDGYFYYGNVYKNEPNIVMLLFNIEPTDYNIRLCTLYYEFSVDRLITNDFGNTDLTMLLQSNSLKTIFGNQSLVGSGNIDLYRHHITANVQDLNIDFVYYSSNSLKIDSLQDLTKVTKGVVPGIVGYKDTQYYPLFLKYINNVWYVVGPINLSTPIKVALISISDEITTI